MTHGYRNSWAVSAEAQGASADTAGTAATGGGTSAWPPPIRWRKVAGSIFALAKDCCAYTHHRATMFDGKKVVVAHPPASHAEIAVMGEVFRPQFIEQAGCLVEFSSQLLLVVDI